MHDSDTDMTPPTPPQKFTVTLDNEILYIDKELAQALGWKPNQDLDGVPLSLHGWEPGYFTITPKGSDSGNQASSPRCLPFLKLL